MPRTSHSEDLGTFWGRLCSAWQERHKRPATQEAIAKRYGMSQPSVGEYVNGALPRMARAAEMAKDLRVCVEWLLTGQGPRKPHAAQLDPFFQAVFDLLQEFPDAERLRVLEYMQFKLEHIRNGWPDSVDEAIRRLAADPGRTRKPQ